MVMVFSIVYFHQFWVICSLNHNIHTGQILMETQHCVLKPAASGLTGFMCQNLGEIMVVTNHAQITAEAKQH